jgi:D-glycero-alpha-D-manno-heptose-7-phosphate kinase
MKKTRVKKNSEDDVTEASAPCRIDLGGTLDIGTFFYPLRHLQPCTFNIALDLRTRVRLMPHTQGRIRITSRGFQAAEFPADRAPFDHPMGLMFAVAAYFNAQGVRIDIESQSPPRSALGGSSVAAVALIAAFMRQTASRTAFSAFERRSIALLAYELEQSVAGVPCGVQDQLAAVFGGVHAWHWQGNLGRGVFRREVAVPKKHHRDLEKHLLLAYCGKPHQSRDINGRWVKRFLAGRDRDRWVEIVALTRQFVTALKAGNYKQAAVYMNRETAIRKEMTPDVLNTVGDELAEAARQCGCGARFTGAGGGGCIWALGEIEDIDRLRSLWEETLSSSKGARLLDVRIDSKGLVVH